MKNKDLIIKTARRLDKFNLDDIIQVTSIDEQEVTDILSELLKEKTLVKNQKTYYFNIQKKLGKEEVQTRNTIKPIVIEEEDGYDYFLTFNENVQSKIRRYVKLLNIVNQTNAKNIKQIIDLFNSTSNEPAVPFSTFTRVLSKFKQSGFEGILPKYTKAVQNYIPEEINTIMSKGTKDLWNEIQIESIFGKQSTMETFYDLYEDLQENLEKSANNIIEVHIQNNQRILEFYSHIKKELGIKD